MPEGKPITRIGLISDTHGLLRPEALDALRGSDLIVHAGDIGDPLILAALSRIAPVTAVRGNNDHGAWADALPQTAELTIGELRLIVIHDLKELRIAAATAGFQVVVAGHSHRPRVERREGVCFVNPGSAGPRRFSLPVSVATLVVQGPQIDVQVLDLL